MERGKKIIPPQQSASCFYLAHLLPFAMVLPRRGEGGRGICHLAEGPAAAVVECVDADAVLQRAVAQLPAVGVPAASREALRDGLQLAIGQDRRQRSAAGEGWGGGTPLCVACSVNFCPERGPRLGEKIFHKNNTIHLQIGKK